MRCKVCGDLVFAYKTGDLCFRHLPIVGEIPINEESQVRLLEKRIEVLGQQVARLTVREEG